MKMFLIHFGIIFLFCSTSFHECVEKTECTLNIQSSSGETFIRHLQANDAEYAFFQIQFSNNESNITYTKDIVMPGKWVWTCPPINYLQWPIDFKILSLGLLSFKTMFSDFILHVVAKNCSLKIGTNETDSLIGQMLMNFSFHMEKHLSPIDFGAKHYINISRWCYFSKSVDFSQHKTILRYIFSYPIYSIAYKCCEQQITFHKSKLPQNTKCGIVHHVKDLVISWPYMLGLVFMIFFPVATFKCASKALKSATHTSNYVDTQPRYDYVNCQIQGDDVFHFEYEEEEGMGLVNMSTKKDKHKNLVFLDQNFPIEMTNYVFSFCTLASHKPVLVSRIRRFFFLLLIPSITYAMVISYYLYMDEFIRALIERKIDVGMMSMLGTFRESISLNDPIPGGPFFLLAVYHVVGFLIICLPSDLGAILERGLPRDFINFRVLFNLDNTTLEKQTFYRCVNFDKYEKIYRNLFAKHLFFFRPKNWVFCFNFQLRRWQSFKENYNHIFMREVVKKVLFKFLGLCYLIVCLMELGLTLMIFICPILGHIYVSSKGYYYYMQSKINKKYFFVFGVLFSIFILIFQFVFCIILTTSFSFLGKVCTFVLIGVLVNPMSTFGYILFVFSMLFYIHNLCESFKVQYYKLLKITTEKAIEEELKIIYQNDLKSDPEDRIQYIRDQMTPFTFDQGYSHHLLCRFSPMFRYVRYFHYCPGIPRDLFDKVIDQMRPMYIHLLWFIIQLIVIGITLLWSLVYISNFGSKNFEILHILTIIGINASPRFIQVAFVQPKSYGPEDVRWIESIVHQYMKK